MKSEQTAVEWGGEADAMIGRIVGGKYRIRARVGGGAMGVVYDAKQIALDKRVAIKVLNDDLQHNKHFVARFQVEAKAASLLDHANSTRVFDFGKDESGLLYICMEFLEGQSLLEVIDTQSPLPAARIVDLTAQTLAALARAHDLGILHRDLKPENIMVLKGEDDEGSSRDVVKVCDFGIAKFDPRQHLSNSSPPAAASDSSELGAKAPSGNWKLSTALTQVGLIIGTPDYMSPEQARGEAVDERSEIYSVGVVLYHLLTGQVPFEGGDVLETLTRHMTLDPLPPSTVRPGVDAELEAICRIAMSKDPAVRYRSARDMRAALRSTAACRRVSGGRAAMFSFVPPARAVVMSNGGPAWSMVPSMMPALVGLGAGAGAEAGPSKATPMAISLDPSLSAPLARAMAPIAPAMRALLMTAPSSLDRHLKPTVPAPAQTLVGHGLLALTAPAPAMSAALPLTVPAPAGLPAALELATTMAGVALDRRPPASRLAPLVSVVSYELGKEPPTLPPSVSEEAATSRRRGRREPASTSSRPAMPVAKLALQEGAARRRRPFAMALAAALTAVGVGGAFAAFGHPSVAAAAAKAAAAEVAIIPPATAAALPIATDPSEQAGATSAAPAAIAPGAAAANDQAVSAAANPPASASPAAAPGAAGRGKKTTAESPGGAEAAEAAAAPTEAPLFQPNKGRVAVVREDAEGFERHLVNELLGHASLERCYVEALKEHGSAATGSTLLSLQVADGKVAAMSISTDLGMLSFRPCLETQLVGQSIGEDATAGGVAHITLQLTDL